MRYLIRSLKYFAMLAIVFIAVTFFVSLAGSLELSGKEQIDLFMANNGALKILFLAIISALYPIFGYIARDVEGNIVENEGQIIVAMESAGFSLKSKSDGVLTFKANTILRRVTFLFEDQISVSQRGESIHIEGVRRGVAYAVYYLEAFIKNSRQEA
ncbi:MAG: hypothetical protein R3Y44_01930 [Rikenellaceae bacterium]